MSAAQGLTKGQSQEAQLKIKRCLDCGSTDETVRRTRTNNGGNRCEPCRSIYQDGDYERRREYYIAKSARRSELVRAFVRELKNKPCADCGVSYPHYVMDFDHRDASEKSFDMAKGTWGGAGIERLRLEAAKCDVVCSNCHRFRTWGSARARPNTRRVAA